jgi:hypothetical protein
VKGGRRAVAPATRSDVARTAHNNTTTNPQRSAGRVFTFNHGSILKGKCNENKAHDPRRDDARSPVNHRTVRRRCGSAVLPIGVHDVHCLMQRLLLRGWGHRRARAHRVSSRMFRGVSRLFSLRLRLKRQAGNSRLGVLPGIPVCDAITKSRWSASQCTSAETSLVQR